MDTLTIMKTSTSKTQSNRKTNAAPVERKKGESIPPALHPPEVGLYIPIFVLRRKFWATTVALLPSNGKATLGALGCFHSQRLSMHFRIWASHATKFTKRCFSSWPHRQHLSDSSL